MHSIYKVWIGKDYFGSFVNCMLADYMLAVYLFIYLFIIMCITVHVL